VVSDVCKAEEVQGMVFDSQTKTLYFSDKNQIVKYAIETKLMEKVGDADDGETDGENAKVRFHSPAGLCIDPTDRSVIIADHGNHRIRRMLNGKTETIAGKDAGYVNNIGAAAQFKMPTGVACDSKGNIYVCERGNNTIRMIEKATKKVSTVCGHADSKGDHKTGVFAEATFNVMRFIALDATENFLYVTCKDVIAKISLKTETVSDVTVPKALKKPLDVDLDSDNLLIVTDEDVDAKVVYRIVEKQKGSNVMTKIEAVDEQHHPVEVLPSCVAVDKASDDIYFFDDKSRQIKKLAGNRACRMCGTSDCCVM